SERTVRVFWFGVPIAGERFGALDTEARAALAGVGEETPIRALVYRETRVGGTLVDLAALDDVRPFVRLEDGRLPRPCTPARCEVVAVGGSGRVPSAPGLPLVVVGRGRLQSSVPFGQTSA